MLLRTVTMLCTFAAAFTPAQADDEPNGIQTFPLPNIFVVDKFPDSAPSIIVRQADEIDFSAWNAYTAADALRHTPGVSLQVGGSSGDAVAFVRGFRDRDVLILFDGIPVANALEGTIDLNEISLNSVEATRVLTGAPSVIYGANGLGGVIDLMPRAVARFDSKSAVVELAQNGGHFLRGSFGDNSGMIDYYVTASLDRRDDFELSDDYVREQNQPTGDRINSDVERKTATLLLHTNSAMLGDTSMFLNVSDAERGLALDSIDEDPDFERLSESRRMTLGLSNRFASLPLSVKAYYNRHDTRFTIYDDATYSTVDEIDDGDDYTMGALAYLNLPTWASSELILNASWAREVFEAEGVFEDDDRAEVTTSTLAAEHHSAFGDLSLALGAIYTRVEQPVNDTGLSQLTPQIAIGYQAGPNLTLHASAAQRTRFPKLREFYRRRWGNPDLKEQSADNYEVGANYAHNRRVSFTVTVFHSRIEGLIDRATRRSIYTNRAPVDVNGFELWSGGWITDLVFTKLGYTYVDISESLPGGGDRQIRSRPRHTGIADLRFALPSDVMLSLNAQYVAGLYDLDTDDVYTRLPGFVVFDVKATKAFASGLSAYVGASNLADRDYLFRLGDPREGRVIRAGVQFGIGVN